MSKQLDFYFDIVSPASYLAWTQLPKLIEDTGVEINYQPIFLPGIFKEAGSASPITVPSKGKWLFHDLTRWAKSYSVPFVMNDRFPLSSVYAMRGLNNYKNDERFIALADGLFAAMWANNQDVNDQDVMGEILSNAGIGPGEYMQRLNDPANKQSLIDAGQAAVQRGVFGAPTFFIGKIMHWGQDRLQFVKEDLMS